MRRRGWSYARYHRLRTPGKEIAFSARPKIHSHSQIFRYGRSIFCLPHRPKFSDFFDLCLHWVSVVRDHKQGSLQEAPKSFQEAPRKVQKISGFFDLSLHWVSVVRDSNPWLVTNSHRNQDFAKIGVV